MKNIMHLLFVIIFVCFGNSIHGMEPTSDFAPTFVKGWSTDRSLFSGHPAVSVEALCEDRKPVEGRRSGNPILSYFPSDLVLPIARYCKPRLKNKLMKVSKGFNTQLKDRELVVQANPFTVSKSDILRGMFVSTYWDDATKLRIWLEAVKATQVSVHFENILCKTAYQVAKKRDNDEIMALLVEYGALLKTIKFDFQEKFTFTRFTPEPISELHEAVYWGNKEGVKRLLVARNDPNTPFSETKITPLCIAVHEGHLDIVQLLIDAGANVHTIMFNGWTPLYVASKKGHIEIVRLLLRLVINSNFDLSWEPKSSLVVASENGYTEIVQLLLPHEDEVNGKQTASLILAVRNGHTKIAKLLIDAGAGVNYVDKGTVVGGHNIINKGRTLLHWSLENGSIKMVNVLLKSIAKETLDLGDERGATPLHVAIRKGYIEIIQSLLNAGADPNKPRNTGYASVHLAAEKGCIKSLTLLLAAGADIHQKTSKLPTKTALQLAQEKGHTDVVEFLQNNWLRKK